MCNLSFTAGNLIRPAVSALAWEEARLSADFSAVPEIYFWQSAFPAVVVGLLQNAFDETFPDNLGHDHVALLRRASGGGAVLLGAGILCFAAFAPLEANSAGREGTPTAYSHLSLRESFVVLTEPVRAAARALTGRRAEISGISDLTVPPGGMDNPAENAETRRRKFSGTAQLRKRQALLVHGAVLVDCDLTLLNRYLAFPSESPEYRSGRRHTDFCITLARAAGRELTVTEVANAIAERARTAGWRVGGLPENPADTPETAELVTRKYACAAWNWERRRG